MLTLRLLLVPMIPLVAGNHISHGCYADTNPLHHPYTNICKCVKLHQTTWHVSLIIRNNINCLLESITADLIIGGDTQMEKAVTFSFSSTNYEGTKATETFTFEKLGIDEDMDDKALKIEIDRLFHAWVWDKLNISYSIIINEENAHDLDDIQ